MNTTNASISSISSPGWQLLGKSELSAVSTSDTVGTWLSELLMPLNLQPDFLKQLLNSAQDATSRALHTDSGTSFEHIHISVFAPGEHTAHGTTWGFFRIDKIDSTELNHEHPDHAVEFYLYLEA